MSGIIDDGQGTLMELGDENIKMLDKARFKGFLSKAFAVAATAAAVGYMAYGIGNLSETATALDVGFKIWGAGMITSLFSLLLMNPFQTAKAGAVKNLEEAQITKYTDESLALLKQEKEKFLQNLQTSGERSLSGEDYALLAILSEDDISKLPEWVPAAEVAADRKAYDDGNTYKMNGSVLEAFASSSARTEAWQQVNHPSSTDRTNNAGTFFVFLGTMLAGVMPLTLLWESFTWKEPEADDFKLSRPETPDLYQMVKDIQNQPKPELAPT